MKNFFNKLVAVLLLVAATVGTSCQECDHEPYDDTELREQIADLYSKLAALQNQVSSNMEAVQQMISGRTAIESCTQDEEGNWILKLTNGKEITVYAEYQPEALPTNLVYTMTHEGELVWATMGTDGNLTPILDAQNQPIPVATEVPSIQIRTNEGMIEISIDGGQTWTATGVSEEAMQEAIENGTANCSIIKSVEKKNGKMIITLQSGDTFEVAIEGESQFKFTYWNEAIDSFYVPAGTTIGENLKLYQEDLIEFIKEIPQGWTIEFGELDYYGENFPVTLTAPTAAAIESGAAVANGLIKLIGVFEGGKSAVATLEVTTNPFKTATVSAKGQVTIEPYNGVEEFTYGILPAEGFTAESLQSTLEGTYLPNGLWSGWEAPYNVSNYYQTINKTTESVYGEALTAGEDYVLWYAVINAVPVNMFGEYNYELGSEIFVKEFSPILVEAEATSITFNNIQVKINFLGFDEYYGGVWKSTAFNKTNCVTEINQAHAMGHTANLASYRNDNPTIETSLANFPSADIDNVQFNTKYTMWVIPVEEGKEVYSEEDMYVFEWTSKNVEAGGTLTVTEKEGTLVEEYQKISVELNNNPEAYAIYYQWYETAKLPAEADLAMDVLTTGYVFNPEEPVLSHANLTYNTSYTLVAVPLSGDGKYGSVCKFEHKTKNIVYSETFKLTAAQQTLGAIEAATAAQFKLTTEGATGTNIKYYYMNLTDAEIATWGGDDAIAAELALGAKYKRKTAYLTDGCFKITGLTTDTQYTLFALAYDGTEYSKMQKVTYTPKNEATIIAATDAKWAASKPTVTIDSVTPPSWGTSYSVAYTVTPAAGTKVSGGQYINTSIKGTSFEKLSYMLTRGTTNYYIKDITEAASYSKSFNPNTVSIYVTWTDAEGNYYEPMQVIVPVE